MKIIIFNKYNQRFDFKEKKMSDDRSNSNKYVLSKHSKNKEDIISQNSHPYSQLSQYTTNSKNHIFKKEGNAYKKISAQDLTKYDLNNTDNNIIKLPKDGLIPVNEIHSFAPIGSQIIGNFHPNLKNSNHSSRYNIRLNNNVLYNNNNYDNDNRKRARKNWKILKSGFYMMQLFHSLRNYSFISKNMKKNRFITVQALKQNLIDIRNFLLPSMINIETFCLEHFTNYISLSTDDNEKYKTSVYIIKSFIHQFFTDLTGSFAKKKDIPSKIKKIFRTFILDNSRLPYGFLTTFEFNRLEFDTEINLKNMNIQRQSLLVGFIILYRILLIDVLRNFEVYFPSFNYENNGFLKYSNSEKSISNNAMDTKMIEQVNKMKKDLNPNKKNKNLKKEKYLPPPPPQKKKKSNDIESDIIDDDEEDEMRKTKTVKLATSVIQYKKTNVDKENGTNFNNTINKNNNIIRLSRKKNGNIDDDDLKSKKTNTKKKKKKKKR